MTKMHPKQSFTLLILALFFSLGQAEDMRYFRIISLEDQYNNLTYKNNRQDVPLFVSSTRLSRPYPLPDGNELVLYQPVERNSDNPQSATATEQAVARIKIPSNASEHLILVVPGRDESHPPIVGLALDSSPEKHPLGTLKLYNFSDYPIAAVVQGKPGKLESRGSILFDLDSTTRANDLDVRYWNNAWIPVYSGQRLATPNVRQHVLILNNHLSEEIDQTNVQDLDEAEVPREVRVYIFEDFNRNAK